MTISHIRETDTTEDLGSAEVLAGIAETLLRLEERLSRLEEAQAATSHITGTSEEAETAEERAARLTQRNRTDRIRRKAEQIEAVVGDHKQRAILVVKAEEVFRAVGFQQPENW